MSMPAKNGSSSDDLERLIEHAISQLSLSKPSFFSLDDATELGKIAAEESQKMDVPIVFSVVDASGHQRYFYSMDNALLISHKLAFEKAWTAVAFKMATHELALQVLPGKSLYGVQNENGVCCFGGGFPCWSHGRLLGAIGVSGGTVEQDMVIVRNTMTCFSQTHYLITPFQ